MGYFVLD
jgi:hypothetical protein